MSSKEKNTENEPLNEEILEIEKKINATIPEKNLKDNSENDVALRNKEDKEIKKTIEEDVNNKIEKKVESKKNYNQIIWKLTILFVITILILIFSTTFAFVNLGKNTIAEGISIDGVDVSNLTINEATNKLNEATNIELMLGIKLKNGEDYSVDFDPNQIQYTYDVSDAVKEAYNVGKSENIILNNYALLFSAFKGKNIEMSKKYNEESLNGIIDDISSKVPGLVVQASYYMENDELIIDKGKSGVQVEKDTLKNDIIQTLKNREPMKILNNNKEENIEIQVKTIEPDPIDLDKIYKEIYKEPKDAYYILQPFQLFKEENGIDFAVSMEEAKNIISDNSKTEYIIPLKITPAAKTVDEIGTEAFPYLISSFTTKYDASNGNRSGNLKIAADKINGTVLMPGEEFSFNEVVGKRTIEEGYTNAKIYENGQVVDGLAGGICQISSTLYNACLLANLEVTERRNHSYTSTYVPAGRDATVVYGTQDFKFKNTRTYPIKLEANVANGIAEFKIHGIKEEVEYEIKVIPVITQTIPFATEYIPDPALAPGQQLVTQAGHSGYKVTTYLEKRLAGVVTSKDIISNDTYNSMKTVVHVGP